MSYLCSQLECIHLFNYILITLQPMKNSKVFTEKPLRERHIQFTRHGGLARIARRIMLAMILVVASSLTGLRAQDYSYPSTNNPEYAQHGMWQYKVTDNARFSSSDQSPTIVIKAECLAADGYGQWTCSSDIGNQVDVTSHPWVFSPDQHDVGGGSLNPGGTASPNNASFWLLLGNQIGIPSEGIDPTSHAATSIHPGYQSTGVVSGGLFTSIGSGTPDNFDAAHCKVVANLQGNVRYVCIDPIHPTAFMVEGFNTAPGTITADGQIDITLSGLPYDATHSAVNRQIVKNPIFTYPTTSGIPGFILTGSTHAAHIFNPILGEHWEDQFDIAIDANYLYIIWNAVNGTTMKKEIWVTVVDLEDGSIAYGGGYPQLIETGTADLIIPTIACEVRNDDELYAQYDVAYINTTTGYVTVKRIEDGPYTYPPNIVHSETLSSATNTQFPIPYYNSPSCVGTASYTQATHERILVSSVAGSCTLAHALYVITNEGLVYYNLVNWSTDAPLYVDGKHANSSGTPCYPSLIPHGFSSLGNFSVTSTGFADGGVIDEPIIAFANPYGGQCTGYDQFHCMYQLTASYYSAAIKPLMIVKAAACGYPNVTSADTRMWLNRNSSGYTTSADTHIGAVNQMGIHLHWRSGTDHYYARDNRLLAQDIEENTLISNSVGIGSGGGQLLGGVKMTIWSDPNYGAVTGGSTDQGIYWQYPEVYSPIPAGFYARSSVGTLYFSSNGLALTVGSSDGSAPANLYTMPFCRIDLESIIPSVIYGTITINPNSTWDFYGSAVSPAWDFPFSSTDYTHLTINLNGPSTGPTIPNLNIHPGAVFSECKALNATHARIDILYGTSIYPINTTSTPNSSESGLLKVSSVATIDHSFVNSFLPYSTYFGEGAIPTFDLTTSDLDHTYKMKNVIMQITSLNSANNSSIFALHSTNTAYTNWASIADLVANTAGGGTFGTGGVGIGMILYDGPTGGAISCGCGCYYYNPGLDNVVIDGGSFNQMRFHAIRPETAGLEITNNTIDYIDQNAIHIDNPSGDYAGINVSYNTFLHVLDWTNYDPDYGIVIENFNNSDHYSDVYIYDNIFTSSLNDGTSNWLEGAILFISSTGIIGGNQITNFAYGEVAGITLTSPDNSTTHSHLCSNTISHCLLGITSDHYHGYVIDNQINGTNASITTVGYESGPGDLARLFLSSIQNCVGTGLDISGGSSHPSDVDLSGYHFTTSDDFAGYNIISGNTTGCATGCAEVMISNGQVDYGNLGTPPWTNWGENNTSSNGSSLSALLIGGTSSIGSIKGNFWTGGSDPGTAGFINTPAISFTSETLTGACTSGECCGECWLSSAPSPGFTVSCSPVFPTSIKGNGTHTMSVQDGGYDTCAYLKGWEARSSNYTDTVFYHEQYDSLKFYIEKCAASDNQSYTAFNSLDDAVSLLSHDTTRYDVYRAWLISVLYLNKTNPTYFCVCLGSIASSYHYGKYHPLGYFVVMNYARQHAPQCFGPVDQKEYSQDSAYYPGTYGGYSVSNLPPLDSLGLGFLLNNLGGVTPTTSGVGADNLASFTSSPNPFQKETTLQFTLNRMAYTTIVIYDQLGHLVWGDGRGSSLEAGTHTVNIDASAFATGTYYARISTGFGEPKTIKLIHEK